MQRNVYPVYGLPQGGGQPIQSNKITQPAPQSYTPWQDANSGYKNMTGGSYAAGVNAQAQKDMSAFGALQNMGISGQNAMANYGNSLNNALVNSQIAQANAQGQLGTMYFNTMGQGMNALQGLNAAASQSIGDSNKAAAVGGLGAGMVNAGMYGAQAGAYGMGNMPNFNFGGGGGFRSFGPEGALASGGFGGGFGGGRQFNAPPPPPYMQGGSSGGTDPTAAFRQSLPVLRDSMRQLDNPDNFAHRARQDINRGFGMTQQNLMNPGIKDSLNSQMSMGYGVLGKLYDKSDYGFNTGFGNIRTQYNPRANSFWY